MVCEVFPIRKNLIRKKLTDPPYSRIVNSWIVGRQCFLTRGLQYQLSILFTKAGFFIGLSLKCLKTQIIHLKVLHILLVCFWHLKLLAPCTMLSASLHQVISNTICTTIMIVAMKMMVRTYDGTRVMISSTDVIDDW